MGGTAPLPGDGQGSYPTTEELITDARQRADIAATAAGSKKGEDIVALDVGDIIAITDVFVIASGTNRRQVRTIVEEVEHQIADQTGVKPVSVEGLDDASWVLLDYGDLVVHVFLDETRSYYDLERLWADAPRLTLESARQDEAVS
ncbi:MAG: ribosome silencing factor [Actinobacteria bacterium]|nr:ribosome silencing factor [Actinomycetota bacterium]